jgi:Pentapeptide repeats (8 copies)
VNLTRANLADATGADLAKANLAGADLMEAGLAKANLAGAIWPYGTPAPKGWLRIVKGKSLVVLARPPVQAHEEHGH